MESRFDLVVNDNFANTKGVFWKNCDNFFHRNDLYILLSAGVLSACEVALIRNTGFTLGFSGEQIDFDDAWVEGRDFRQIHAECPDFV